MGRKIYFIFDVKVKIFRFRIYLRIFLISFINGRSIYDGCVVKWCWLVIDYFWKCKSCVLYWLYDIYSLVNLLCMIEKNKLGFFFWILERCICLSKGVGKFWRWVLRWRRFCVGVMVGRGEVWDVVSICVV